MVKVEDLIEKTKELEKDFLDTTFLAPVKGLVVVKLGGMVYRLRAEPEDFEGWAVLKPKDYATARVISEPQPHQVYDYLKNYPSLRCILLKKIRGRTWLSLPYNLSDAAQRFKISKPFLVHLVERGGTFEQIKVSYDGLNFWYESASATASLEKVEKMREELTRKQEEIKLKDLTREERMAYSFMLSAIKEELLSREERKIRDALKKGGAELSSYLEAEEEYVVKWKFEGEEYITTVRKQDLAVVSSGICLSGREELFDLTSIVGVMREHEER